ILAVGGYFLYRSLMPKIIAEAVVAESLPNYIPKRLKNKVDAIRTPLNKGTEAMLQEMHASEIPLDDVLEAVDDITEEQAYSFLDEMNKRKPASTNEVFDVAKKHFSADFDMEVFREPFNKHFEIDQIKNAIAYANMNRKSNDVDISTAKAIFKKIIVEKEKEVISKR
ncbi:MAG: hypothetical protein WD824_05390, partial [Cyclobacteriaceae bacterium]